MGRNSDYSTLKEEEVMAAARAATISNYIKGSGLKELNKALADYGFVIMPSDHARFLEDGTAVAMMGNGYEG